MKYLIALIVIVVAIIGISYLSGETVTEPETPEIVTVNLSPVSPAEITGTATLSVMEGEGEEEDMVKVVINVATGTSTAATSSMPVHIHSGSCANLGAVVYPLENIVNGASETILEVGMADLLEQLPLAINAHKSDTEIATYVSCGDIILPTDEDEEENNENGDGTATTTATTGGTGETATVMYGSTGFSPSSLEIMAGDTVRFENKSTAGMWVASDPHPVHTDFSAFDQKTSVSNGGTYEFTFTEAGTYTYHNHQNPTRTGTIIVK